MKVILYAYGRDADAILAELTADAGRRGWQVSAAYRDGALGTTMKGRAEFGSAIRRKRFDVVSVRSIDQLGTSLPQIVRTLDAIRAKGKTLHLLHASADGTTILAASRDLVKAVEALQRARQGAGKSTGRPRVSEAVEQAVVIERQAGGTIRGIAAKLRLGIATVQRIVNERADEL